MWNIISGAARVFNRTNLPGNLLGMLCLGDDNSPVAYGPWWSPSAHKTQPAGPPPPPPPPPSSCDNYYYPVYAHFIHSSPCACDTHRERDRERPILSLHTRRRYYIWDCSTILRCIIIFMVINCTRPTRCIFRKSKKRYAYYVYHRCIHTSCRDALNLRVEFLSSPLYIKHKIEA